MPSVLSAAAELSESRLGKRALVERTARIDPFYTELGNKLSATESGSAVQFGRRQLPSGFQQPEVNA